MELLLFRLPNCLVGLPGPGYVGSVSIVEIDEERLRRQPEGMSSTFRESMRLVAGEVGTDSASGRGTGVWGLEESTSVIASCGIWIAIVGATVGAILA